MMARLLLLAECNRRLTSSLRSVDSKALVSTISVECRRPFGTGGEWWTARRGGTIGDQEVPLEIVGRDSTSRRRTAQADARSVGEPFRFLDLPLELQERILGFAFVSFAPLPLAELRPPVVTTVSRTAREGIPHLLYQEAKVAEAAMERNSRV